MSETEGWLRAMTEPARTDLGDWWVQISQVVQRIQAPNAREAVIKALALIDSDDHDVTEVRAERLDGSEYMYKKTVGAWVKEEPKY